MGAGEEETGQTLLGRTPGWPGRSSGGPRVVSGTVTPTATVMPGGTARRPAEVCSWARGVSNPCWDHVPDGGFQAPAPGRLRHNQLFHKVPREFACT